MKKPQSEPALPQVPTEFELPLPPGGEELPMPEVGGSYVRQADGSLTLASTTRFNDGAFEDALKADYAALKQKMTED